MDLGKLIPEGAGIWWGQGTAEPLTLLDTFIDVAEQLGPIRAFAGLTWNKRLVEDLPPSVSVMSYGALGHLRKLAARGRLEIIPTHYSGLPRLFASGMLPTDVGLLQVSPPDSKGLVSLGVGADYMADAIAHTRTVLAEINHRAPTTRGPRIPLSRFATVIEVDRALPEVEIREPDEIDRRIASNVCSLIDDGDTIQIGVGSLPEAVMSMLADHQDLGVHSGIITDGVVDLIERGVINGSRKQIDSGVAVGGSVFASERSHRLLPDLPIELRPTSYTHSPAILSELESFVSVNSAIQVDLFGQVGAETANGRQLGAIGGQVDFSRAAALTGGRSIIALRSTVSSGPGSMSTIVPCLDVPATTPRMDVDFVVTEHGIAELSGATEIERRRRLLKVTSPEFRTELEGQRS